MGQLGREHGLDHRLAIDDTVGVVRRFRRRAHELIGLSDQPVVCASGHIARATWKSLMDFVIFEQLVHAPG